MALGTYAELVDSIGKWIHRTDLADHIPDSITFVEAAINTGPLFREMETVATLTIAATTNYVTLPSDYLALKSVRFISSVDTVLELLPDDTLLRYNADHYTGTPQFYSIRGSQMIFSPEQNSDTDQTVEVVYYAKVPALSGSVSTNWLLSKAPNVYLWGALFELTSFVMDDERALLFKSKFDEAVDKLKKAQKNEQFSGSPIRSRSSYII